MQVDDARAALAQNQSNQTLAPIAMFGLMMLGVTVGVSAQSWLAGVVACFLPLVLLANPRIRHATAIGIALVWGVMGLRFGVWIGGAGLGLILAVIFGAVSYVTNSALGQVGEDQQHGQGKHVPGTMQGLRGQEHTLEASALLATAFRGQNLNPHSSRPKALFVVVGLLALLACFALSAGRSNKEMADKIVADMDASLSSDLNKPSTEPENKIPPYTEHILSDAEIRELERQRQGLSDAQIRQQDMQRQGLTSSNQYIDPSAEELAAENACIATAYMPDANMTQDEYRAFCRILLQSH